jgi:hypothetical protein
LSDAEAKSLRLEMLEIATIRRKGIGVSAVDLPQQAVQNKGRTFAACGRARPLPLE